MGTTRGARAVGAALLAIGLAGAAACGPPPCPRNTGRVPARCEEACTCSECASMYARNSCGWRDNRCVTVATGEPTSGPGAAVTSPELCTEPAPSSGGSNTSSLAPMSPAPRVSRPLCASLGAR